MTKPTYHSNQGRRRSNDSGNHNDHHRRNSNGRSEDHGHNSHNRRNSQDHGHSSNQRRNSQDQHGHSHEHRNNHDYENEHHDHRTNQHNHRNEQERRNSFGTYSNLPPVTTLHIPLPPHAPADIKKLAEKSPRLTEIRPLEHNYPGHHHERWFFFAPDGKAGVNTNTVTTTKDTTNNQALPVNMAVGGVCGMPPDQNNTSLLDKQALTGVSDPNRNNGRSFNDTNSKVEDPKVETTENNMKDFKEQSERLKAQATQQIEMENSITQTSRFFPTSNQRESIRRSLPHEYNHRRAIIPTSENDLKYTASDMPVSWGQRRRSEEDDEDYYDYDDSETEAPRRYSDSVMTNDDSNYNYNDRDFQNDQPKPHHHQNQFPHKNHHQQFSDKHQDDRSPHRESPHRQQSPIRHSPRRQSPIRHSQRRQSPIQPQHQVDAISYISQTPAKDNSEKPKTSTKTDKKPQPVICHYCGLGRFRKKTTTAGYIAAVLLFPLGTYACLSKKWCVIETCTYCGHARH